MSIAPRIVGFGGTLARTSTTIAALKWVLDAAAAAGGDTELIELGPLGLPIYDWGMAPPPAATELADKVHRADALVWASPLYHGTVSGLFKNAVDWLEILRDREPPYLTDKPIGLVAVASGSQSLQAITTMEHIARSLRGWAVPFVVPVNHAAEVFGPDGVVLAAPVQAQLEKLGAEIVRAAEIFRAARPARRS